MGDAGKLGYTAETVITLVPVMGNPRTGDAFTICVQTLCYFREGSKKVPKVWSLTKVGRGGGRLKPNPYCIVIVDI